MGTQIQTELKNEKESKQISPLNLFDLKTFKALEFLKMLSRTIEEDNEQRTEHSPNY